MRQAAAAAELLCSARRLHPMTQQNHETAVTDETALTDEHEEQLVAVEEAVVALLNVVVTTTGDVTTCLMCGKHDEAHTSACPVTYLEEWLRAQYN